MQNRVKIKGAVCKTAAQTVGATIGRPLKSADKTRATFTVSSSSVAKNPSGEESAPTTISII